MKAKIFSWISGLWFGITLWAARHCPAKPWSILIGLLLAIAFGIVAAKLSR